jgi:hypothetical protein
MIRIPKQTLLAAQATRFAEVSLGDNLGIALALFLARHDLADATRHRGAAGKRFSPYWRVGNMKAWSFGLCLWDSALTQAFLA